MFDQEADEPTGIPSSVRGEPRASDLPPATKRTVGRKAPYKPKVTPMWENFLTMGGIFLSAAAVILLVMFTLFTLVSGVANPYVDIVGYLVIPSILVFGVLLIPFGILFKSWRVHRHDPAQRVVFRFPRVDLNDPKQRKIAKITCIGASVLLPVVALSGYHGYHYTDSAGFCSKACHRAMHPQATTYEYSAHARVACAECHIGSGASWFVKAKLSGTRQVLAMLQDSFPRPIPSAITDLRPARETCEQCHWPSKFFGAQLKELVSFTSDKNNTRREIDMLLKTGGGDESRGVPQGIHKHMALANVEYIATDERLQVIPWVKYTEADGTELIYRSDGKPSSDPRPEGQLRQMDCMDCHNRPAHKFRSPIAAVDDFLYARKIDGALPFIKREAVAALAEHYPDEETALERIGERLAAFYKENYPEVWRTRLTSVNEAIDSVREIYGRIVFPKMNVDWRTYPDNIGHKISPGCFRCHEGKHVNQRGETISHACNVCHTFLNPVVQEDGRSVVQRGDFVHPVALEGIHASMRCDWCHTGGVPPLVTCEGCHTKQTDFRSGATEAFAAFEISEELMAGTVECESCHDLSEPVSIEAIDEMCMECHDDEEFEGMLAGWKKEIDELLEQADKIASVEADRELLDTLREAGPLHNVEASRLILGRLIGGHAEGGSP